MQGKLLAQAVLATPIIDDETTISVALQGVTDYFASLLHARNETEILQLKQWINQEGGTPVSWLIGHRQGASARQAALLNGFQAHFLDYDDVHEQVRGHPSAVILSALFASLKITPNPTALDSRRFLTAYIIGVEMMARLGEVMNPSHYNQGWHATGTLGGIAAAAALCYLHQWQFLDQAFSLAASQAAGLRLAFSSPLKPLHAGLAAQAAIQTVELLQTGLTAPTDFLAQDHGFVQVYAGAEKTLDFADWGQSWRILTPGLWFKTYRFCSAAATVADAAKLLKNEPHFAPAEIDNIALIFNPQGDAALIYGQIANQAQGRFSAEYIVAKTLLGEPLDNAAFANQPVTERVRHLMTTMHRRYAPSNQRFGEVKVRLKNGEFLTQRITVPKGSPHNPYSAQELYQKLAQALSDEGLSQRFFADIQRLKYGQNMQSFIEKYWNLL